MDMMTMLAARRAMQRRTALRALGIGVTAVAAGTVTTEARGKKGKGRHKAKDRCPAQVATCEAAFAEFCAGSMAQAECVSAAHECCASLKTCDAGTAMDCVIFRFLVA